MSYSNVSLNDRLAEGFIGFDKPSFTGFDQPSNYVRNSAFKYLHRIYTVKGEAGNVGSVFFEFVESKPCSDEHNYRTRVFKDISKSPDLQQDDRIPQEAKKGFCFGIKSPRAKSLEDLIEKVEHWVAWGRGQFTNPVQVIALEASDLCSNPCKMPIKNYDKIYQAANSNYIVPLHLLKPSYIERRSFPAVADVKWPTPNYPISNLTELDVD